MAFLTHRRKAFRGGGTTPILDTYTGSEWAYSTRLLSSTYTGKPMRVRRTGTATTVDLDFDSNDEISLDSAITYVSGASTSSTNLGEFVFAAGYTDPDSLGSAQSAHVSHWRDQSGGACDLLQATEGRQPRLVSSGTLDTINGKAALWTDGVYDWFYSTGRTLSATGDSNVSTFTVSNTHTHASTSSFSAVFALDPGVKGADRRFYQISTDSDTLITIRLQGGNHQYPTTGVTNADIQISTIYTTGGAAASLWRDGSSITQSGGSPGVLNLQSDSGCVASTGDYQVYDGTTNPPWTDYVGAYLGECIFYLSDESSSRTGIEGSQKGHWGTP